MKEEKELIKFKNNPLKSVGNIMHWIYVYGNLSVAEDIQIGENNVYYNGKLLCEFNISSENNIPIFHGFSEKYKWIDDNQYLFLRKLNNLLTNKEIRQLPEIQTLEERKNKLK